MEDVLKWAREQGLIDPFELPDEELEESLQYSMDNALEKLRAELERKSPDSFHNLMSWWAWFSE